MDSQGKDRKFTELALFYLCLRAETCLLFCETLGRPQHLGRELWLGAWLIPEAAGRGVTAVEANVALTMLFSLGFQVWLCRLQQ